MDPDEVGLGAGGHLRSPGRGQIAYALVEQSAVKRRILRRCPLNRFVEPESPSSLATFSWLQELQ